MAHNPSDKDGPVQSQSFVQATIVDINDPLQQGRVKVRILGEQDDESKIPDDQLQWVNCMVNGESQNRTVGTFPPHQYTVGSKIGMQNMGSQQYIVMGAMTNNEQDDGKRDSHPNATSTSPTIVAGPMAPDSHAYSRHINGKFIHELEGFTQVAYSVMRGLTPSNIEKGDAVEDAVNKAPTKPYGGRRKAKKGEWDNNVGKGIFPGSPNATKYLQEVGAKELVPNAISMIETLKETAKSAGNPKMPDSIGGMGNILGALAGIATMMQQAAKGSKEEDDEILEEWLRKIYKAETGKEPLDLYGNETIEYKKWRIAYLAAHQTS